MKIKTFKNLLTFIIFLKIFSSIAHAENINNIDNNKLFEPKNSINTITKDINEIKEDQLKLLNELNNKPINLYKEIGLPILLSIIAGLIFWIFFQVLPSNSRKKKLRPKIEKDLLDIRSTIYHLIDLAFLHNQNPVSLFHNEIHSGELSEELIQLALFNKAINRQHLVDHFSGNIVIGDLIYKRTSKIKYGIERIFFFNEQLSVNEILILEDIYQGINEYDFFNKSEDSFGTKIGNQFFRPLDPSLSGYSRFFFNLYNLVHRLEHVITTFKSKNYDFLFIKFRIYFNDKNYMKALAVLKEIENEYPEKKEGLQWNIFKCLYYTDNPKALKLLKEIILKQDVLIGSRNYLSPFLNDPKVQEVLKNNATQKNINDLENSLRQEQAGKEALLNLNKILKESLNPN